MIKKYRDRAYLLVYLSSLIDIARERKRKRREKITYAQVYRLNFVRRITEAAVIKVRPIGYTLLP